MKIARVFSVLILLFFIVIHNTHALEQEVFTFTAKEDKQRFESLTKEIRCVVCQNQSLADSNAPLANDLRAKIYLMVLDKKSNPEIKQFLVKRYGDFILLSPRFMPITAILWLFPFLALCFAGRWLCRFTRL